MCPFITYATKGGDAAVLEQDTNNRGVEASILNKNSQTKKKQKRQGDVGSTLYAVNTIG